MPHVGQHEAVDPIAYFGEAHILVHDILVDAEQPGDVLAARVLIQHLELVDICLRRLAVAEEAEGDQLLDPAPGEPRELMQIVFGVILQPPELPALMADGDGLDMGEGVGGEQHPARRQMGDLVDMADEAVEDGGLAEIERMARDVLSNPVIENYRVELDSELEP